MSVAVFQENFIVQKQVMDQIWLPGHSLKPDVGDKAEVQRWTVKSQEHRANHWQSWDQNSGALVPKLPPFH